MYCIYTYSTTHNDILAVASRCNNIIQSICAFMHSVLMHAGVPLSPSIVNHTEGATWISLVWHHNQSCCTNGSYSLLWKPLQSEEAVPFTVRTVDPSQHPNITHLNSSTTYIVTLVVECHRDSLQSIILNTSISKLLYAFAYKPILPFMVILGTHVHILPFTLVHMVDVHT